MPSGTVTRPRLRSTLRVDTIFDAYAASWAWPDQPAPPHPPGLVEAHRRHFARVARPLPQWALPYEEDSPEAIASLATEALAYFCEDGQKRYAGEPPIVHGHRRALPMVPFLYRWPHSVARHFIETHPALPARQRTYLRIRRQVGEALRDRQRFRCIDRPGREPLWWLVDRHAEVPARPDLVALRRFGGPRLATGHVPDRIVALFEQAGHPLTRTEIVRVLADAAHAMVQQGHADPPPDQPTDAVERAADDAYWQQAARRLLDAVPERDVRVLALRNYDLATGKPRRTFGAIAAIVGSTAETCRRRHMALLRRIVGLTPDPVERVALLRHLVAEARRRHAAA